MRRIAAVLLSTALAAAGSVALTTPAAATYGEIVPRDLIITVTNLGPERRTCEIDADLYVPRGVTAARPGPALLMTNGFGGTKEDQADFAQGFGELGYVSLAYTGIGFVDGDTCPITLDDVEHDGAAASQLLRFLGGDRSIVARDATTGTRVHVNQVVREDARTGTRFDPAVGMIGGSYGGQIQFAAAAFERRKGTDRLDAIVPFITWNDLSYSLAPENSSLPQGTARSGSVSSARPGVFKYQWAALFTSLGVANGAQDLLTGDQEDFEQYVDQNCANFEEPVCQALAEVMSRGYPSPESIRYLRSNSVASYTGQVRVPTLLGQGQADTLFNLQESVATYTALKRQGTPVKLMWQSWGHSDNTPLPELDERNPENSYQGRQVLAWFEHYVRGTGPAPALNFSYYRDWVQDDGGSVAQAYATAPSFPVGSTRTFHLSGSSLGGATDGQLVPSRAQVQPGLSEYSSSSPVGPNYSETSGPFPQREPFDPPASAIRFATPALDRPVTVVGSPRLTVQLGPLDAASSNPDTQLVVFAKLYDVSSDGAIELPQRLISPARVADPTKPFTIELPGIVHRFEKGHRLVVVLAGGDAAYRGSNVHPRPVTLTTGPDTVQRLALPVVG